MKKVRIVNSERLSNSILQTNTTNGAEYIIHSNALVEGKGHWLLHQG